MDETRACPLCGSASAAFFYEALNVPVHVCIQYDTRKEAKACPRGDIRLARCDNCGLMINTEYDPNLLTYQGLYENSLHFSPVFQHYAQVLAENLITNHDIYDKNIIEIGCGRGDFLTMLCNIGNNRGIGYDPSFQQDMRPTGLPGNIEFVSDYYSEQYVSAAADFYVCRHVLEHLHEPLKFLQMVRNAITAPTGVVLYFEVPNMDQIIRTFSVWDVIYEHYLFFTQRTLTRMLAAAGFTAISAVESFNGQYLGVEAVPATLDAPAAGVRWMDLPDLTNKVGTLRSTRATFLNNWHRILDSYRAEGKRVVTWGAGAAGVGFLNMLAIDEFIEYSVDINPRKQGKFIAGTGQQIIAPEALVDYQPDVIIIMNRVYEQEIKQKAESLGLTPNYIFAW